MDLWLWLLILGCAIVTGGTPNSPGNFIQCQIPRADEFPMTKLIYCYVTDSILARVRRVGAHFGFFFSAECMKSRSDLRKLYYCTELGTWRMATSQLAMWAASVALFLMCHTCWAQQGYVFDNVFKNVALWLVILRGYKISQNRPKFKFGNFSRSWCEWCMFFEMTK